MAASLLNLNAAHGQENNRAPAVEGNGMEITQKALPQNAMDVAVEMSKISQLIENKEREIRFNSAELMSLEIDGLPDHEKEAQQQRLALANEVLTSEIEDLAVRKTELQTIVRASVPGRSVASGTL